MKKLYGSPEIAVKNFENEDIVTTSTYAEDVKNITISGNEGFDTKVLEWKFVF